MLVASVDILSGTRESLPGDKDLALLRNEDEKESVGT